MGWLLLIVFETATGFASASFWTESQDECVAAALMSRAYWAESDEQSKNRSACMKTFFI